MDSSEQWPLEATVGPPTTQPSTTNLPVAFSHPTPFSSAAQPPPTNPAAASTHPSSLPSQPLSHPPPFTLLPLLPFHPLPPPHLLPSTATRHQPAPLRSPDPLFRQLQSHLPPCNLPASTDLAEILSIVDDIVKHQNNGKASIENCLTKSFMTLDCLNFAVLWFLLSLSSITWCIIMSPRWKEAVHKYPSAFAHFLSLSIFKSLKLQPNESIRWMNVRIIPVDRTQSWILGELAGIQLQVILFICWLHL